jgi:hypothetical protein
VLWAPGCSLHPPPAAGADLLPPPPPRPSTTTNPSHSRYDYEGVESEKADAMMAHVRQVIAASPPGTKFGAFNLKLAGARARRAGCARLGGGGACACVCPRVHARVDVLRVCSTHL